MIQTMVTNEIPYIYTQNDHEHHQIEIDMRNNIKRKTNIITQYQLKEIINISEWLSKGETNTVLKMLQTL